MSRSFVVGLTGSIGMGKTTTADMFRDEGCPVWDADAAVHKLYASGGEGAAEIARIRPDAIKNGAVDRSALKAWIDQDEDALSRIERVIHPLVQKDRHDFVQAAQHEIVVLDIPLLLETGDRAQVDLVVVVSAPDDIQRARVLERSTMSEAQFDRILEKQMPDAQKRAKADVVIETVDLEQTRARVRALIADIRQGKYARNRS